MKISIVEDIKEKAAITKTVLEQLEPWFGIESARENYIQQTKYETLFAIYDNGRPVGFISLKKTSCVALEIAVMGVCIDRQRKGYGHALIDRATVYAIEYGYRVLHVKTVATGSHASYDKTNLFYQHEGFLPLEILPTLWDPHNPCQLYVKIL